MSHTCFIDESGDRRGLLSEARRSQAQPVYVVLGLIMSDAALAEITPEFVEIRKSVSPVESEVKGNKLRGDIKQSLGSGIGPAGFVALKAALQLLDRADIRVTGRVSVKPTEKNFDGNGAETRALEFIVENFSRFLQKEKVEGGIVFDSRGSGPDSKENKQVERAMQKAPGFSRPGLRKPTFSRSEDCIGLQLADWICSALIAPPAATAYCDGCARLRGSPHIHENYLQMRDQYGGDWLWRRQLRFQTGGKPRWGLEVDDPRGRSSALLFRASAGG